MAIRSPRISAIFLSPSFNRSVLEKDRTPADRLAICGRRFMTANAVIDLPQPDSPTRHKVSPDRTVKLIFRTACSSPAATGISTLRSMTSRRGVRSFPSSEVF